MRTQLQEQIDQDPIRTLAFSYDPSNQLTSEQVSGGKTGEAYTASYAYDSAGNRTRYENTSGANNTLTLTSGNKLNQTLSTSTTLNGGTPSTASLSYDAAGNLAQVSSSGGRSDYVFDDANRLVQFVSRNAAGEAMSKSEFVYDGLSRLRISRDYDYENGAWVSRSEKRRLYDGLNAVQERNSTGALLATYTRGTDMGGGIGGLLARSFEGGTSFYHYDGRGNVTGLSDVSGAVSGKYTYDAFGNTLSVSGGEAGLNPYRFSTKEHIGGLVYYGYRFYSPSMSRWLNRDPIEESGGVNLYKFVDNDPINYVDSNGLLVRPAPGFSPFDYMSIAGYFVGTLMFLCKGCRETCQKCCIGTAAAGLLLVTAALAAKILILCSSLGPLSAVCVAAQTTLAAGGAVSIALGLSGCMQRCASKPRCCKDNECK